LVSHPCVSFSSLFLRPGNPELKVRYEVSELRDGKSLSTYRVDAYQDNDGSESLILTSTSSALRFGHDKPLEVSHTSSRFRR
jgi:acyl-CoA thioesterase